MSASFTIAARNNGFTKAEARDATLASVNAYRTAMAEFAEMGTMDIWYAHLFRAAADGGHRELRCHAEGDGQEAEEGCRRRR